MARAFPAAMLAAAVGVALWIALEPSWNSYIFGGVWLGVSIWFFATLYAIRRASRGKPMQIVATAQGLRSPVWELDWDRVDRIRIGYLTSGGGRVKALFIEPHRGEDVRRPGSDGLWFNSLLSNPFGTHELRILEANVDMPLVVIAAEFERLAGRSLLR